MLEFRDIKFDCVLYNGYKPCKYGNECRDCQWYERRSDASGDPSTPVKVTAEGAFGEAGQVRILIIKTGAMGDVLRTTTLLAPLRRVYPQAHITWVTAPPSIPLLMANPNVDRLLALDGETVETLMRETFDLLLNFEKESEPLALAGKVPARRHLGFAPTRWNTPTVFNPESEYALLLGVSDELKFRKNRKTYPEIIAEMACLPYARDPYQLFLTENGQRRRADILAGVPQQPRIGINTGCGSVFRTKQWTLAGWVELSEFLHARLPHVSLLLLGGEAERELNAQILQRCPYLFDTGCDNKLDEFVGVVDACDLVVSSDSLAMHIAIARQKWVVAIFGSTSPVEIELYDRGEKIVTDFSCSPCYLKTCDKQPTCMEALGGDVVGAAVLRGLQRLSATQTIHSAPQEADDEQSCAG
jgi:heptosyltransferase-2